MATICKMGQLTLAVWILLAVFHQVSAKAKYVSINLNAKWNSTPLLLETSEYLAVESNDLFWNFINSITELDPKSYVDDHDEAKYQLALKYAGKLIPQGQVNLLKFSLALRAHSPTVEMYNQMARDKNPPKDCNAFVDIHNMVTCERAAIKAFLTNAKDLAKPTILKNDHHYPGTKDRAVTVILYAEFGTETFDSYHKLLRPMAEEGEINYILRHYVQNPDDRSVRLSGYGVELAIKNQEYKARDDTKVEGDKNGDADDDDDDEEEVEGFIFATLKKQHPDLTENLERFRSELLATGTEVTPLKVWQLQDLSFQAAQRVASAPKADALRIMRDISQNFPTQAASLVKTVVKEDLRREIQVNQKYFESSFGLQAGDSALLINGLQADLEIYDVFTLLDTLKSEARMMEGLHNLGIKDHHLSNMLKLDLRDTDSNYAVDIRDKSVVYINDLEKDKKYMNWPSSVQDLLRPTFPGMLRHVRKNFFHLVFIVDPSNKKYKDLLKMAEAFYVHNAPIRVGLVFVVNPDAAVDGTDDAGVAMLRAFNYMCKEQTPVRALSFITDVYDRSMEDEITASFVMQEFEADYSTISAEELFGPSTKYDTNRKKAHDFLERTGLGRSPQVLLNGIPMKPEELEQDSFEEAVVTGILRGTPELQKSVYDGRLNDHMDMLDYIMSQSSVMQRLNNRVLAQEGTTLDLTADAAPSPVKNPAAFASLSASDMSGVMVASMKYMAKKDDPAILPLTNWIVTDLETPEGRALLYHSLRQVKSSNEGRVGVIHNSASLPVKRDGDSHWLTKVIQVALETQSPGMARSFVMKLLKEENVEALAKGTKDLEYFAVNNMDFTSYMKDVNAAKLDILVSHRLYCERVLEFSAGERGIINNGKVIGQLRQNETFLQEDFALLEKYTMKLSAQKIKERVEKLKLTKDSSSDMIMQVSSLLMQKQQKESRKNIEYGANRHSVVHIPPKEDGPAYAIDVILDPTSKAAQKYSPILMVLQEVANVDINIYMNCREKLSEMPLKSYYRFVLEPEVTFGVNSQLASGPSARFNNMPQKPLLTLGMDPPESWLVEAVRTAYDLDNIYLEEIDTGVHADFELEYLLVEGHCYDSTSGQPPRGLQFILGSPTQPAVVDTIVMANLGYFQLKATPRAWQLGLRQGRSSEIYNIVSHEYTDSLEESSEVVVTIDSFKSKIIKIRVNKKPGKEHEDLLGDEEPTGLWDSLSKKFTGTKSDEDKQKTINIFSLASGHLYERLLRIMMASVMKHTQSKVKFWFLKNYLSPSFKDFIPHMAREYNFEYELVQYKWPRWLHQQTEKQRMIWGYKILFLDVLFPLDVEKIIFVDADQIVRTDLQELMDFDLEGAPYGYTPFCSSRPEMDGFRFWKSGYWASHLAGRAYHISALYVVDLKKFRKIAAGDRLRGQYQGLSQDPNSLSNLDQDLPNNMIHQVTIKSLPQEWLWCETWCSDADKAKAKTIDLCNNPQTKEPKLVAAQRIIPEWKDYDGAIKQLWEKTYKGGVPEAASNTHRETTTTSKDKRDEL